MKLVALVSGGKDSCYNMMKCVEYGHEIACIANLAPPDLSVQELDSWMFQTVGHNVVSAIAECMEVPLFRGELHAIAAQKTLEYNDAIKQQNTNVDEVEELYALLSNVKNAMPDVKGVSCGAIFSDYQRLRVENVCARLGLVSFCFLWRRDQSKLLDEMIARGINAILIKTATMGLSPQKHCGRTIAQLQSTFEVLKDTAGLNVCGEGGEYETMTLDCPLFKKRIVIDKSTIITLDDDPFAPVGHLHIQEWHLEQKTELEDLRKFEGVATIGTFIRGSDISFNNAELEIIQTLQQQYIQCDISKSDSNSSHKYAYACVRFLDDHESNLKKEPFNNPYLQMIAAFESIFENIRSKLVVKDPREYLLHNVVIVKCMDHFSEINRAYSQYFNLSPPSRVCVECENICGCLQIECFLVIPTKQRNDDEQFIYDPSMFSKKVLHVQSISEWAPACIGPYSQATVMCNVIRSAGQIALIPQMMVIPQFENRMDSVACQMRQCLHNIHQTLTALSSCITNVFRCIIYVDKYQINSESDCKLFEQNLLTNTWNQYLKELESDQYVEQYARYDVPKFNDLFRIVYVSKLPRSSIVEYHTYAVNKNIGRVNKSEMSPIQIDGVKLLVQSLTCYNDNYSGNSFHIVSIHVVQQLSIVDNEQIAGQIVSKARDITKQRNGISQHYIMCRMFVCPESENIAKAVHTRMKNTVVSYIMCDRIALSSQENQVILCCEFESLQ